MPQATSHFPEYEVHRAANTLNTQLNTQRKNAQVEMRQACTVPRVAASPNPQELPNARDIMLLLRQMLVATNSSSQRPHICLSLCVNAALSAPLPPCGGQTSASSFADRNAHGSAKKLLASSAAKLGFLNSSSTFAHPTSWGGFSLRFNPRQLFERA